MSPSNPRESVPSQRTHNRVVHPTLGLPSARELADLLSAAVTSSNSPDLPDAIAIIANTGIRSEELCALRWADVDLEERFLSISPLKGPYSRRIPFGERVFTVLSTRRNRQPACEYVLGRSPRAAIERVARQCRLLSLRTCNRAVTLRMLRLAFLKRWIQEGGSPEALALIAGNLRFPRHSRQSWSQRYLAAVQHQAALEI